MKLLTLILLFASLAAYASPITVDQIVGPSNGSLTIQNGQDLISIPSNKVNEQMLTQGNAVSVTNKTFDQTSNVDKQAFAVYDFSVQGGASAARINLGMGLPTKAVITKAVIDVITQPTGSLSPTVAISAQTSGDILGAIAVAGLVTGQAIGKPAGTSTTMIKLTAATGVTVDIAGTGPLTAGKFAVIINYFLSQ